jgi:peptidoglycan/LPS O-acetylase OafA/YrhL
MLRRHAQRDLHDFCAEAPGESEISRFPMSLRVPLGRDVPITWMTAIPATFPVHPRRGRTELWATGGGDRRGPNVSTTRATEGTGRKLDAPVRLHGLDTLRGLAAVLVVMLHAGVPYMVSPLSNLVWPARDGSPSSLVDGIVWSIEGFVMPLFFLLAGFFSAGLLSASSPRSFLSHRTKRILWPMVGAFVVVLVPCVYIWSLGWTADGVFVPRGYLIPWLPKKYRSEMFGMTHLWFLQYLYIYCIVLCAGGWLAHRIRNRNGKLCARLAEIAGRCDRMTASPWKLVAVVPCAVILYWDPRIIVGFYQGFLPVTSKLLFYAIFFVSGGLLYRTRHALLAQGPAGKQLLTAAAAFACALPLIHQHLTDGLTGPRRAVLAGLLSLYGCLAAFGLFRTFLHTARGHNAVTRYLAEASYWVYLVHLPFVVLAQIAVARLPVVTAVKFLLSVLAGMSLSLLTYEACARYTWVGAVLNGVRRQRAAARPLPQVALPATVPLPDRLAPAATIDRREAA